MSTSTMKMSRPRPMTQMSFNNLPTNAPWLPAGPRWPRSMARFAARRTELADFSQTSAARRLYRLIRDELDYDMALMSNGYRLEWLYLDYGLPHYRLIRCRTGRVVGIVNIYHSALLPRVQRQLAGYLVSIGFKPDRAHFKYIRTPLDARKYGVPSLFRIA